ncbi:hypothetical protein GYMLUDRAFT_250782 [Collybiopsis luxurians FD-317 M1]|uniref:Uncharacterized protein n=1 Tax=Collybiopsis luxurians FD-317 M1 TaxID=944289 RepID=A0A0D0C569_9AGAR|nr:hypothetical protein GYMLUDRAFT_250782 [Collybiopsis luxurians FD-317 M1]
MSARFDAFDVGYRPTQPDAPHRLNSSRNGQPQHPQGWQPPASIYVTSHPPPPPPPPSSHSYQQNSALHNSQYGGRSNGPSSVPSRAQEPPRQQSHSHSSNYSIHRGISTDMYIYEASDNFSVSEYSPSPSPFSPALSTDSTATLQPVTPIARSPSTSRDRDGRTTPSLRVPTPAPQAARSGSNQSGSQSQAYPPSSYSSSSTTNGIPFPGSLPGVRQAQTALRGLFGSNGQGDRAGGDNGRAFPPPSSASLQVPDAGNFARPRTRTLSASSNGNVLLDSDTELDHLARMNTALNAGYSYYYPQSKQSAPSRSTSPNPVDPRRRSPRDSLVFYNGIQHIPHSPDMNAAFLPSQPAPTTAPVANQAPQRAEASGPPGRLAANPLNLGTSAPAPPIGLSISNSSQSSEYSIIEVPPRSSHLPDPSLQRQPQTYPAQTSPIEQISTNTAQRASTAAPSYTTVLSSSPEPLLSSSSVPYLQVPTQNNPSPAQLQSSPSSTLLNRTESDSSTSTMLRDPIASSTAPLGNVAERRTGMSSNSNQGYPMPRGNLATDDRSLNSSSLPGVSAAADPLNISQSRRSPTADPNRAYTEQINGELRTAARGESGTAGVRTRKPSVTSRSPNSSPPRTSSRPAGDASASSLSAHPVPAAASSSSAAPPPPPAAPQQQPQLRVRKDSTSLGMSSSSASRSASRSYPNPTASYPNTNIGHINGGPNGERLAASSVVQGTTTTVNQNQIASSAVPTRTPSSIPEPRRRHSDGDNPSLTDATRRSSVPFQTEFVPSLSNAASAIASGPAGGVREHVPSLSNTGPTSVPVNSNSRRPDPTRDSSAQIPTPAAQRPERPEPSRTRSTDPPTQSRPAGIAIRPMDSGPPVPPFRSVRWTEELICPSPIWPSQRRKGWFNRRGDQLWTNGGSFKAPPPGQEYPPDLDGYPEYGDGWMNEEGVRIDMAHRLIPKPPLRSALKAKRANGSH